MNLEDLNGTVVLPSHQVSIVLSMLHYKWTFQTLPCQGSQIGRDDKGTNRFV